MQLVLNHAPTGSELEETCSMLEANGLPRNTRTSRPQNEPAYSNDKAVVQFNGDEVQIDFTGMEKQAAQQIIDDLIKLLKPISYYSIADDLSTFLYNSDESSECGEYNFGSLPYGRREEKPVVMDELARDLFCEMCGPIRNSVGPVLNLIVYCKQKDVYDTLPELVRHLVDVADEAMQKYQELDDRVSEIFQRLPKETLQRYADHSMGRKDSQS